MKKYFFIIVLLSLAPCALFSQAETFHQHIQYEIDQDYPDNWVVHIDFKLSVNQVRKINKAGDTEIRYTNNYNLHWVYNNTVTGERKVGPEIQNVTGVYSFGPGHWENDRHWVYHYVNDPVFGAYHINFNLLWQYDDATGFMEIRDVQNEWVKN